MMTETINAATFGRSISHFKHLISFRVISAERPHIHKGYLKMPEMLTRQSTAKPWLVDNIFLDQVFLHLPNVDTCSPRNHFPCGRAD